MSSSLGNKIGSLREQAKLSQRQLGELIGKKKNTIGSYEGGHSEPGIWTLKKIANQFHVTTDFLLDNGHATVDVEGLSEKSVAFLKEMRDYLLELENELK